jgi:hypothetical protein
MKLTYATSCRLLDTSGFSGILMRLAGINLAGDRIHADSSLYKTGSGHNAGSN